MFKPFSSKLLYSALSIVPIVLSAYTQAANPPPNNSDTLNQPTNRPLSTTKGKEEIAYNDPSVYQTTYRGDWDYRQNWKYDRNAYLSGMNQSQFDAHMRPDYGYGRYNYGYGSEYNNYPNTDYGYGSSRYNSGSGYSNDYYPRYGYNNMNSSSSLRYESSYPDYAMYYPQQGINTGYGSNSYGDSVYYRHYPDDRILNHDIYSNDSTNTSYDTSAYSSAHNYYPTSSYSNTSVYPFNAYNTPRSNISTYSSSNQVRSNYR